MWNVGQLEQQADSRSNRCVYFSDRLICMAIGTRKATSCQSIWSPASHCSAGNSRKAPSTFGGSTTMAVIYNLSFQSSEIIVYIPFDAATGLTLLIPHIISNRSTWSQCKLRIFCTASNQQDLDKERQGYIFYFVRMSQPNLT